MAKSLGTTICFERLRNAGQKLRNEMITEPGDSQIVRDDQHASHIQPPCLRLLKSHARSLLRYNHLNWLAWLQCVGPHENDDVVGTEAFEDLNFVA
jgi:hypothetical protein